MAQRGFGDIYPIRVQRNSRTPVTQNPFLYLEDEGTPGVAIFGSTEDTYLVEDPGTGALVPTLTPGSATTAVFEDFGDYVVLMGG